MTPLNEHDLRGIRLAIERIERLQILTLRSVLTMNAQVDQNFLNLQTSVANETTVEQSAITLLGGLSAQLAAAIAANNNGDSAALPALQAQIDASSQALAAAVAANTPGAPVAAAAAKQ
jgi:hypothetical protein